MALLIVRGALIIYIMYIVVEDIIFPYLPYLPQANTVCPYEYFLWLALQIFIDN